MAQLGQSWIVERKALVRDTTRAPAALRLVRNLAVQDWVTLGYFAFLLLALVRGHGETRGGSIARVLADVGFFLTGLVLARGGFLREGSLAAGLVYRVTLLTSILASYLQLREILPAVSSRVVDAEILAFDLRVFGTEPALEWERFITPQTTEWFAFFYFLYFFLLVIHILPMAILDTDRRRLAFFVLGTIIVFCVGHIGYMLVPGYGPHRFLDGRFTHDLEGGTFWGLVVATVRAGGAQKDIFPSLHTAVPTWFAIFSFLHRRSMPFRYTWPIIAFTATQIALATMFLRWHWLVDVIAGLVLATLAAVVARKVTAWEELRRERLSLSPVFTPLRVQRGSRAVDRRAEREA
jgi:hypothetical protein